MRTSPDRRLAVLAWTVLWFTVAVILGGSVVRATGSGDGCGETWPRCEGSLFPLGGTTETAIEFTHRAMTVLLGIGLVALALWVRRATRRGDPLRRALLWTGVFFVGEVIIGALLVVFGWVDDDASLGRVVVVPLHLVNTLFLLGSLAVAAHLAGGGAPPRIRLGRMADRLILAGGAVLLIVAAAGALNALADTLFPADSFLEGLRDEFGPTAPFLVRLRVVHPLTAIVGGIALVLLVRHPSFDVQRRAAGPVRAIGVLVFIQFAVGVTNVALATPVELQVLHLLLADVLWVAFVLAAVRVLAEAAVAAPGMPSRAGP
jgi:heme A synthase